MPHHVYTTPGFIVHSQPSGEAGKYLLVFTRDQGMVGAAAQGVRLSQSKLRYHTQDYSYGLFSLVRGKELWRMTGAKEIEGKGEITEAEDLKLYARILTLLKRLLPGEEKNEKLFEVMEKFYEYLSREMLSKEERELVEYVTVLRILNELGYVKKTFEVILSGSELNLEVLRLAKESQGEIIKEINSGLKESQL